jgi:hypothetical protein
MHCLRPVARGKPRRRSAVTVELRHDARASAQGEPDGSEGPKPEEQEAPRERLGTYAALTGGYAAALGAFVLARRRKLPQGISPGDLALIGVATHKTSRALAKEKVTAPLRVPFTEHEGEGGPGELEESPRGSGFRHAVGELLVCPYCLDQWVATGYAVGLVTAPRATRFVAGIMATVAISDFLQIAYKASERQLGN